MMDGLFGPTPDQIQQAQQMALQQRGDQLARMDPFQRANSMIYSGAGGLMGGIAEKMGGVNPQVQQAQKMQSVLGDQSIDTGTSQGLMALAQKLQSAGMPDKAFMVVQKANEMKRQEAAAVMAGRKQDLLEKKEEFNQTQQFELQRETRMGQLEIQRQTLEQRAIEAKQRSEDTRYTAEMRREAAAEAAAARRDAAMTRAAIAQMGQGKPIPPAQLFKQKQAEAKSSVGIRQLDDTVNSTASLIEQIEKHPGLPGATGMSSLIWSRPGGEAKSAENLIEEFKAQTALAGLNLSRQGGGIGAMTEKEWPLVERMVAAIDPRDSKNLIPQMKKVLAKIEQIRENARLTHSETFDSEVSSPNAPAVPGLPTQDAIAAEIARRQGGK